MIRLFAIGECRRYTHFRSSVCLAVLYRDLQSYEKGSHNLDPLRTYRGHSSVVEVSRAVLRLTEIGPAEWFRF
jgi:hypothetical protein